jgi:hypothetical protein
MSAAVCRCKVLQRGKLLQRFAIISAMKMEEGDRAIYDQSMQFSEAN